MTVVLCPLFVYVAEKQLFIYVKHKNWTSHDVQWKFPGEIKEIKLDK